MKKINWRYALGELIIVVIGISIAFALNNWAVSIEQDKQEHSYLKNIQSDLQQDIEQLDSNVTEIEKRLNYLQQLMSHLRTTLPGRDTMAMKIFRIADPVKFSPVQATIQSMQFSGDLKLISNLQLKNDIIHHYAGYERVDIENERHVFFAKSYLADYFLKKIDYSQLSSPEGLLFLNDPYFHNIVYGLYGIYRIELKVQQQALESAHELKQKLFATN